MPPQLTAGLLDCHRHDSLCPRERELLRKTIQHLANECIMWLLNAETLKLVQFVDLATAPEYAILSHTWGDDEVLFSHLTNDADAARQQAGFLKVRYTCQQAHEDGYQWIWIDSCCIDKSSSAELSEAINSMFSFYQQAGRCYVYLSDLDAACPELSDETAGQNSTWLNQLSWCRWFKRGWTLQELIAPADLQFRNKTWNFVGHLNDLLAEISTITKIDVGILSHRTPLSEVSVAERFSWASERKTTRIEDEAYSLLGLFSINMPLLYGEGQRAFTRLQEEIIRTRTDLSILAWNYLFHWDLGHNQRHTHRNKNEALLADSPAAFQGCEGIVRNSNASVLEKACTLTSKGLKLTIPQMPDEIRGTYTLNLNCHMKTHPDLNLALRLQALDTGVRLATDSEFAVAPIIDDGGFRSRRTAFIEDSTQAQRPYFNITIQRDEPLDSFYSSTSRSERTSFQILIDPACNLIIVDAHPRKLWNLVTGTMAPTQFRRSDRMSRRTAVLLRHETGEIVTLAMDYHILFREHVGIEFMGDKSVQEACDGTDALYDHENERFRREYENIDGDVESKWPHMHRFGTDVIAAKKEPSKTKGYSVQHIRLSLEECRVRSSLDF
ncbi:HET domain protein, protein [Acrodontium crateriforme]|uniref:HET domain protein, protein n=1 Tax=Acrodontium crateriforme TaxID=150365 RepID=A0AAQ3M7F1_9PEZI|nr:HET domain protein, protein [Acrodontium crateriforme]